MAKELITLIHTGADFLTGAVTEQDVFAPEKFDEEEKLMARTAADFMAKEVLPRADRIENAEPGLMRALVEKAGEVGLLMADVPEKYGGLGAGLKVSTILAAQLSGESSFSVAWGAHTSIGILPIIYFGSEELKTRYLPGMATGSLIGAYALTEAGAGSDAMAIKTRATLAPDGQHYLITGAKQWISNAGFADIFTVFAKIDDAKFTAFVVEAQWEGVSTGAEEKKMGLKGSSTRTVYFDNVKVPVENILGEIGKGHKIAFNILNIGRVKLGAGSAAECRAVLELTAKYANERRAFGKTLANFGLIQKKLAYIAADTYATESIAFRTVGMIEDRLAEQERNGQAGNAEIMAGIEEYAIEVSIAKVFGSEATGRSVDEGVQIFGGYGFMHEYPIERAYRDARITRIAEGTNEINRLLIAGTLLKRVVANRSNLLAVFPAIEEEIHTNAYPALLAPAELLDAVNTLERAKRTAIYAALKAAMKFMSTMEQEQEFLEYVADAMINLYAVDSSLARAIAAVRNGDKQAQTHVLAAQLVAWRYLPQLQASTDHMLHAAFEGEELAGELQKLHGYRGIFHLDAISRQRELASILVAKGGYPLFDIQ